MSLKEKQVAAKQTFVFLGSLANEYPAKQDVECDSTEFVSSRYNRDKQKIGYRICNFRRILNENQE